MSRTTRRRAMLAASLLLAWLPTAPEAWAGSEQIRWMHPTPATIRGFVVHWGPSPNRLTQRVDVGMPNAASGVYSHTLSFPDGETIWVAVSAYDAQGREGPVSSIAARGAGAAPGSPPAVDPTPPSQNLGAPGKPQILVP